MGGTISPFLCHRQGFLARKGACLLHRTCLTMSFFSKAKQMKNTYKYLLSLLVILPPQSSPTFLGTVHNVTKGEDTELFISNNHH